MTEWPHFPAHIFDFKGSYMVTGGTLYKEHFFKTPTELNLLQDNLFKLAIKYEWNLEAWALFSNHYHIIVQSPENPETLRKFITHFHANTARELNKLHNQPGRRVWYQFWDSQLTYQSSYYARLNYVMQNPVKHGIVDLAQSYPWCSTQWFSTHANKSHKAVINSFKTDAVHVLDDF